MTEAGPADWEYFPFLCDFFPLDFVVLVTSVRIFSCEGHHSASGFCTGGAASLPVCGPRHQPEFCGRRSARQLGRGCRSARQLGCGRHSLALWLHRRVPCSPPTWLAVVLAPPPAFAVVLAPPTCLQRGPCSPHLPSPWSLLPHLPRHVAEKNVAESCGVSNFIKYTCNCEVSLSRPKSEQSRATVTLSFPIHLQSSYLLGLGCSLENSSVPLCNLCRS
ncbi:uncharacterized protein LOC125139735 [Tachysurus fulvidraco]|uniref:uncharacterized protein LOC125139735 n=1 Tax=Tachysurus fulvidraco TaxID=1234273 RepID=UPI001FEE8998|nr:uncharacterized protein LOC125139735 [Tachysurus fulvidraco]